MTPTEFISKWRAVDLKERTASQSHFNDICRLLEIEDPISADPKGEWFTFEKGASKTGGGEGWADVWRKECFAWEYKGRKKDLDKAFAQLQQYAIALDNPLLIVSDMDRFRIHTNWTNTVQEVHEFAVDDLIDAGKRDLLRNAFLNPEALKPAKTRAMLTEEAAQEFSTLAQRLRGRDHPPHEVAHFVNRLVFCMFAEDAYLLPDHMFTAMLKASASKPDSFAENASTLFRAMSQKNGLVGFTKIDWFNGGLFDDDSALPLERADIENLITAAALDWSEIDPSILGTLFERGLDPDKRSQLGAHYTDRDKIMQIVEPVIIRPLSAEWDAIRAEIEAMIEAAPQATAEKLLKGAEKTKRDKAFAKAQELLRGFIERLRNFRVLDPACGSGNFLYLSLLALKDMEHRANLEAEALGCTREFPAVGPESVMGIELNPYAAELARVSVWIGEIQWMRRNGFEAAKNPILRNLSNIENRDAVLRIDLDGKPQRAEWPDADVVVGNPPFLGSSKMMAELGEDYTAFLRGAWPKVPGGGDLVCYWFAAAWDKMAAGKLIRAGFVATNSIRGGANREVLKPIVDHGQIFEAWSDEEWTVDGAAVRVSLICFDSHHGKGAFLNGKQVKEIHPDLTGDGLGTNLTLAKRLPENTNVCFEGMKKYGNFEVDGEQARSWLSLPLNVNGKSNSEILFPWLIAIDVVRRPLDRWAIDFSDTKYLQSAAEFEAPFEHVKEHVYPVRQKTREKKAKEKWWLYQRSRPLLRDKLENLTRYVVTPIVAKHRVFAWLPAAAKPSNLLDAIARDDDTSFGILHSKYHELWALRMGTSLEDRPRYTPSTTFETFPFPEGLTPDIPAADYADDPRAIAIAAAAARLNELRENWLNPADLVERVPEVVPGYPDRILPKDEAAAKELKKRTLTNLYNARPAWLDHAHAALDEAVAEAYGWEDDYRAGTLTDDETLARLFRLNQDRAEK